LQAPLHENEEQRIAALRELDLLDTLAEPEFDELVKLAAALCNTPISLITLIDEHRQWFKATVGLSERETPREISLCAYAILQRSLFAVEDTTRDERFANFPTVTGPPHIRFYAGVPIESPGGMPVGTLCVIDRVPRQLTPEQIAALEILAHQVNTRLELRMERKALKRALAEKQAMLDELEKTKNELEEANRLLRQLVTTDDLTGLRNRRAFDERLKEEFLLGRTRSKKLSVAILDIDDFKQRNDQFGHAAGDQALKQLATVLRKAMRQADIVARYGGEEFMILLPGTGLEQAHILMDRVLEHVHAARWPDRPVTISIGVAELDPATDIDEGSLKARADEALYEAKRAGKDQTQSARLP
jgi:diguanylate cyclase (GGDEF)-like protein